MSHLSQIIYRIDKIEVDPSRASFLKDGEDQRVRPKTLAVLYYLLENRSRIVSKEELLSNVWRAAVTEDALTQCISDLRKLFGDDPRNPRYIRTVPKQGFLFIGPVEEFTGESAPNVQRQTLEEVQAEPVEQVQSENEPIVLPVPMAAPQVRRWPAAAWIAIFALVGAAGLIGVNRHPLPPRGRTSIALTAFENRTGRPDLNWMREGLPDMLSGSLLRSPKLILLPAEPMPHSRPLQDQLQAALKRHAQVLITGAYTVLGDAMRVELRMYRTADRAVIGSEILTVEKMDEVLTKFDGLAVRTAAALQAPLPSNRSGGVAEARTTNLEAYKLYTLGVDRAQNFHPAEAIALFERAVEIDRNFYMANARIGYAYAFSGGLSKAGLPYLKKALEQSESMNGRDRMFIEAWYAFAVGDIGGTIKRYQRIVSDYPDELSAYVALARLLRGEKRLEDARGVLSQALAIDPDCAEAANLLGGIQFTLGQKEAALASVIRYADLAPNEPNAHDSLGMIYHRMGRYQEAMTSYRHALALKPNFEVAMVHFGNTLVHLGRYREAIAEYRRFVEVAKAEEQKGRGRETIAWVLWKSGRADEALREMSTTRLTIRSLVEMDASGGRTPKGLVSLDPIDTNSRGSRSSRRFDLAMVGLVYLRTNRPDQALDTMRAALRELPEYYLQTESEECLADAYLELGKFDEAIAEYRRALELNPNLAPAHYGLGKALAKKRDVEGSRAELRKFLEIWKDADRDLKEYRDAVQRLQ